MGASASTSFSDLPRASARVAGEGVEEPPPRTGAAAGLRRVSLLNLAVRSRKVDAAGEGGNAEDEASVKMLYNSFAAFNAVYPFVAKILREDCVIVCTLGGGVATDIVLPSDEALARIDLGRY